MKGFALDQNTANHAAAGGSAGLAQSSACLAQSKRPFSCARTPGHPPPIMCRFGSILSSSIILGLEGEEYLDVDEACGEGKARGAYFWKSKTFFSTKPV